jgi:hypothetical protein
VDKVLLLTRAEKASYVSAELTEGGTRDRFFEVIGIVININATVRENLHAMVSSLTEPMCLLVEQRAKDPLARD